MSLALRDRCGRALIDVHAHYSPPVTADMRESLEVMAKSQMYLHPPFTDWSVGQTIELMDSYGIALQLLSFPSQLPLEMSQQFNNFGAEIVAAHPQRFGLLASVPAGDAQEAVREIRRAADELRADGFIMLTNYSGTYLGDPKLEPVLHELNDRSATVFLHPATPSCFLDLACGRPGPVIEFPIDTARTVVDAVYARVFQRFPNVNFILAHGGGALTALVDRVATTALLPFVPNPREVTAEDVRSQVAGLYYETALAGSPFTLLPLLQATTPDHIVFGTDYPPAGAAAIAHNVEELSTTTLLTDAQFAQLADVTLNLYPALSERIASHQRRSCPACRCTDTHTRDTEGAPPTEGTQ
jgi:predicted TIM-barrel fold metal-dependent hydrolase